MQRWQDIKTHPKRIKSDKLTLEIMEMREADFTLEEIGQHYGLNRSSILKRIEKAMNRVNDKTNNIAERRRNRQLAEIRKVLRVWMPLTLGEGDSDPCEKAANVVHKFLSLQAKLLGTEAPKKASLEVKGDLGFPVPADPQAMAAKIKEILTNSKN